MRKKFPALKHLIHSKTAQEVKMFKRVLTLLTAMAAVGFASHATAQALTSDQYRAEKDRIATEYKANKETCKSMSGNAKDVCMAQADGKQSVAKADAEAAYKGTDKSRMEAQIARADAVYKVDTEKCGEQAGNAKAVCKKDAKASYVHAKADAKAGKEIRDIRKDAASDKRDADYDAAVQRCSSLAGDAKSQCQADAKAKFGKS
jgi:hypothetical protein